jgi:tRNA pseudouridine38-40 synthase
MPRYLLTVAYRGTAYAGWQIQPGVVSIQSLVQHAVRTVCRDPSIKLTGAGRTDAGVHAFDQKAHIDTSIDDLHLVSRYLLSFNALLPDDVRILKIEEVASSFHARYSAVAKEYHYQLQTEAYSDPFAYPFRHHIKERFSLSLMQGALRYFQGRHDFTSFANQPHHGAASRRPVKNLYRLDCFEQDGGVRIEFEGDGFLYKMVRNITGYLLDVAAGRKAAEEIPSILAQQRREAASLSAPARGLTLVKVHYENLHGKCAPFYTQIHK